MLTVTGEAQSPQIKIPDAGVPQVMTLEGRFVRAAYNNEAYAILGYRLANTTVGEEWMLIEFGTTVRERTPDYTLKGEHLSLSTPDGKTLPLPSIEEYRAATNATQSLIAREKVIRDSIDYFPPTVVRACRIGFFADVEDRALPWDEVELSKERGCLGRLFFKVPGGSTHGQYFLNVTYAQGSLQIPFRILTKDEEKLLNKHYASIKKQVDEAFKPKKKCVARRHARRCSADEADGPASPSKLSAFVLSVGRDQTQDQQFIKPI